MRFEQAFNEAKMKRRGSPPRGPSPKREKSPVQTKKLWKPQLTRPHSAHQLKKLDLRAETPTAANYYGKKIQAPSLIAIESLAATPSHSNQSATLPKMVKTPSGASAKSIINKPGRKPIKALTPNESIKFFFPMGNMPPLVEPEKPKEIQRPQKIQKPQRPATANPQGRAPQDHRLTKVTTQWERRPLGSGISNYFNQDEVVEEDQKREEIGGFTQNKTNILNNFKDFMNPKVFNKGHSARNKGNDSSSKWTSIAGEPTDDPYSLKRINRSSGVLGRSDENESRNEEGKRIIQRRWGGNYLSRKYAVNTIQRHFRGWHTRRMLAKSGRLEKSRKFWTGLSDVVKQDFENKGKLKEYYVVMVYDINEETIYVEMKDFESKALYKGRIEYKIGKEELKQVCWKLKENIAIENNRIVFNTEVKEELMDEISERTDESDVGPLIEALEKEAQSRMFFHNEPLEEIEVIEEIKVQIPGSKESYEETSKSSSLLKFEKSEGEKLKKKLSGRSEEGAQEVKVEKNTSLEKPKEEMKSNKEVMNFKNFKINISNTGSIEEEQMKKNKNILFTKRIISKGQVLTVKVETHYSSKGKQKLMASVYDARFPEKFETVDLPSALMGKKDLSLEEVMDLIVIDFDPFRVSLNPAKHDAKAQDSFSSYNDASIALDISGHHTEKEPPAFHRSESLRKPTIPEERKMLRGFSSGTIDSPPACDRDQFQYLGLGLKKPRNSGIDDSGRFSAACKVSEASSGKEYSSVERQGSRRGFRDSRSTLSPRDGTHRSEAEGSIMLRVSEGIASHCRVSYMKGRPDVTIKYGISQEDNENYEEVKIGLDELGLGVGELEKDLVLERVRGLLGKRLKYRKGKLIYEKKQISRENTQREEEKKITLPTMPKIDELTEETEKKKLEKKDSKRLRDEGEAKNQEVAQNKELKIVQEPKATGEEKRKSYGEVKSGSKTKFEVKEEVNKNKQEGQEVRSAKGLSRENSGVQSKKEVFSVKEVGEKVNEQRVESPELKKLGSEELEKTYVETFGAIHTEQAEEGGLAEKLKKIEIKNSSGEQSFRPLAKKLTIESDGKQEATPRMYEGKDITSPKRRMIIVDKSLVLPQKGKQEECSPKIKSNESSPKVYIQKDESSPPSIWSPTAQFEAPVASFPEVPEEEKKRSDGRRRTLKRSTRSYAGDIPKIVIHKDEDAQTVMDFAYPSKAMSMGTLESQDEKEENEQKVKKGEKKKKDLGRISFGGVPEGDMEEWAPVRVHQRGEKLTARFNDLDGQKRNSISRPAKEEKEEFPLNRAVSDTVRPNAKNARFRKGTTGKF